MAASTFGQPMRRRRRRLRPETIAAYLFILPWAIGFLAFSAGPMLMSIVLIGMDWALLTPPRWIGMGNLVRLVHDHLFWVSVGNTVYIVVLSVPLYLATAFGVALLLNVPMRGSSIYRVICYIPSQVPVVASALLWLWIFNPQFGLANDMLAFLHLPAQTWFLDPNWAKPCLIIMGLWGIGTGMVIFLASLQGVPEALHEAAMLDGASALRRFWNVTVPMVSPVILFQFIIGIVSTFQAGFAYVYIITQGGPDNATTLWILYIYQKGFEDFRMGYAATLSWALFLVVMLFTFVQFRLSRRWVYYEDSGQR